jgi:hypothetical protein
MTIKKIMLAGLLAVLAMPVYGQALSTGKVSTAAPTYANGAAGALSLDTAGNLRVVSGGAPVGTQDVNITEVGGNAVTTTLPIAGTVDQGTAGPAWAQNLTTIAGVAVSNTTPGTLDVTCIAGCVAGAGVVNAEVTAAPPSYVPGNEPITQDQNGNLRVIIDSTIPVDVAGTIAATQSGAWNVGLNAGTNNIGDVDVLSLPSIPAGTNNIGDVDVLSLPALPAGTNEIGTVIPSTAGLGLSNYSLIAANTTNATSVKAAAGSLYELSVYNNSSTIAYLKLYDSASAPTCGSGTPVARYLIPGASTGGAGSNVNIGVGKSFASGIAFCITTGIADADTGAVAASAYLINLTYK